MHESRLQGSEGHRQGLGVTKPPGLLLPRKAGGKGTEIKLGEMLPAVAMVVARLVDALHVNITAGDAAMLDLPQVQDFQGQLALIALCNSGLNWDLVLGAAWRMVVL